MAIFIPRAIVTKKSRLDIRVNPNGIYFTIYSKIGEIVKNKKSVSIFVKYDEYNNVVKDAVTIKVDPDEMGLLINILELYTLHPSKTDKLITHIQKLVGKTYSMELVNNYWTISFFRPNKFWSIILLPDAIIISIRRKEEDKNYTLPIALPLMKFAQKLFERVLFEYFEKHTYVEENYNPENSQQTSTKMTSQKKTQTQYHQSQQIQQQKVQPQQTMQPAQPEIIDDEDEFDFD